MLTIIFYVNTISVERGFNPSSIFFCSSAFIPVFVGPVSIRVSPFVQQIFDFLLSHEQTARRVAPRRPARKSVIALIIVLIVTTQQRDQYSTLSHVSIKQLSLGAPDGRGLLMINVLLTADSLSVSTLSLIIHN